MGMSEETKTPDLAHSETMKSTDLIEQDQNDFIANLYNKDPAEIDREADRSKDEGGGVDEGDAVNEFLDELPNLGFMLSAKIYYPDAVFKT